MCHLHICFHLILMVPLIHSVAPTYLLTLIRVRISWHVLAKLLIVSRMSSGDHHNKELADMKQTVY